MTFGGMPVDLSAILAALARDFSFVERRSPSDRADYLEAVLSRQDLKRCYELLLQHFGSVAKDFGQPAKFDRATARIVDRIGGIWMEQCLFFLKVDGSTAVYAALWPWSSDATRVTLKAGKLAI